MNTHLGICKTCGYTTNYWYFGDRSIYSRGRNCPRGHGEMTMLHHKYAKLINRKGSTGEDRLRRFHILMEQSRINDEEQRIGRRKRIGVMNPAPIRYVRLKIK